MPVYPCPECGAQLRSANPVPAGKKLRCPKCETVFSPAGKPKVKATAPPAVQAAEPDEGSYGVVKQEENKNEDATRAAFDPIKERFKLSARGPALILTVRPATWLLRNGVGVCLTALFGVMFAIWPMIFKVEDVAPPDKMARFRGPTDDGRKFKELTPEQYRDQWILLGASIFQFAWGAVICGGASKMHVLEAYPFAMIASVMGLFGPFVPLSIYLLQYALAEGENYLILPSILGLCLPNVPVALMCIMTLRNKKVIAGFAEEKPEEF
jgi:hypothetical protein